MKNYNLKNNLYFKPKKKNKFKKVFWLLIFIVLFYNLHNYFFTTKREFKESQDKPLFGQLTRASLSVSSLDYNNKDIIEYHTVTEGDIPAEVFSVHGKLDANDTANLLESSRDVYDFTNLKIGQPIRFYFNGDKRAYRIEYEKDTETIIVAQRSGDDFYVSAEEIKYDVSQENVTGVIDEFFYKDALDEGLSESTIMGIADIFAYAIDFTTEIRKGDEFGVIYEKRKRGGKKASDGKILAAKFINDGEVYKAYYFGDEENGGYYDEEGREIQRQFLRAPLSFVHITSGFTGARLHPITKQVSAHYQIDYAAPVGTPVVSTARGTVIGAGWENGWGYIVRIRHSNGYTTQYAHLSDFAKSIHSGSRVAQGQVVGYVGSTGWSTGAHLDYGMRLNGTPVNPLKLDLPKGEPLPDDKMDEFEKIKKKYEGLL